MVNQIYYAGKLRDEIWTMVSDRLIWVRKVTKGPHYKVRVREVEGNETSRYWGWENFEKGEYEHIMFSRLATVQCFQYGQRAVDDKEEAGEGKLVNLVIEEMEKIADLPEVPSSSSSS